MWYISVYFGMFTFNLAVFLLLTYIRMQSGSDRFTKGQLWGMSLLSVLFLLNSILIFIEFITFISMHFGENNLDHWSWDIWNVMEMVTSFLLLAFGLVYPRPLIGWKKLRWIMVLVLGLGSFFVLLDAMHMHRNWIGVHGIDLENICYLFCINIPVFIWLGQYSRARSPDNRMIYTIFIWGFLFIQVTQVTMFFIIDDGFSSVHDTIMAFTACLVLLAAIRLAVALWGHKDHWSTAETTHIAMFGSAFIIGVIGALLMESAGVTSVYAMVPAAYIATIIAGKAGWMLVRPALFTYGLLRYRLMGPQVRADVALRVLLSFQAAVFLAIIFGNLFMFVIGIWAWIPAAILGLLLSVGLFKFSSRFTDLIFLGTEDPKETPLHTRRNIYMMGLQTAMVQGEVEDKQDKAALDKMKEELIINDREHNLLIQSMRMSEHRLLQRAAVQEGYLIHRSGLLVAHYRSKSAQSEEDHDSDIFAGMLTAILEYVLEAFEKDTGDEIGGIESMSYGPLTLVMEKQGAVVLALLISGDDDLELRHQMRDALAEFTEKFPKEMDPKWNGEYTNKKGTVDLMRSLAIRIHG